MRLLTEQHSGLTLLSQLLCVTMLPDVTVWCFCCSDRLNKRKGIQSKSINALKMVCSVA